MLPNCSIIALTVRQQEAHMLTQAQKDLIEEKVQDIINKAEEYYNVDLGYVDISFSLKGRVAGKALWTRLFSANNRIIGAHNMHLQFNQEAFIKDWNMMLTDTIPHEIAHLVCAANPVLGKNHDNGWKQVCQLLGGTGETYHKLNLTPGRTTKRFIYTATCGTNIELSHVLHNRIQNGQHRVVNKTRGKIDKHCPYTMKIKGE